ncbi:NAD(P)-dependent alcohol dehydrogenase [Leptospira brenneri]|uniref:NAD(P)-dependent alcohol dehydrogenase n=1 Tax=Leptospira brenneri TaxID=2023182 RepID=A0A2M9Y0L7_9LEPT|nr:NAD(P)-dependent alcohol dehydrogenase [Leptospira brenneri]PJZ44943.1 NAD(P)-dependent alcohol dehydrogenase [Leptospira brenneri]TGK95255.1 NAD(P)-dependent alcohol dehydrogenase [Leptospira brenneri]
MKVITCRKYGAPEVLQLEDWATPNPKKNEVKIKIYNTSVNSADWRIRKPDPQVARLFFGLTKLKYPILGGSFSGVVETVGEGVTKFKVGDRVFGSTGIKMGAYAEFICLPESAVMTILPKEISFSEGATLPFGSLTAIDFLHKCKIKKGQSIIIYGASSSVGTATIQLAKNFGVNVTAVCSKSNFKLVQSLGADFVMDYEEFHSESHQKTYDIVFECVGKSTLNSNLRLLSKDGVLVLVGALFGQMFHALWISFTKGIQIKFGPITETLENLEFLSDLSKKKKFKVVIDRSYPLEAMPEAHRYVEAGHKKGNVVIDIFK